MVGNTLNIYEVLEALNTKINSNTISNNLLLEKLNSIDGKMSSLATTFLSNELKNKETLNLQLKSLKSEILLKTTKLDTQIVESIKKSETQQGKIIKDLISKESKTNQINISEIRENLKTSKQAHNLLIETFTNYQVDSKINNDELKSYLIKKTDIKINNVNKSTDLKIDEQNLNINTYKSSNDERMDIFNENISILKQNTDDKLSEIKEWFISNIDTLNRTHSQELENTNKTFETNIELQSNETKVYLLEELNKINQVNLDFLSSGFSINKEEIQKFLFDGLEKTKENNHTFMTGKIKFNLDNLIGNFNKIKQDNQIYMENKIRDLVGDSFKNMRSDINGDLDNMVNKILNSHIL